MKLLFVAAIFLLIALVLIVVVASKAKGKLGDKSADKYLAKSLLTENEKHWYKAIKEAVPHAHVFGQVAMNQLMTATGEKKLAAYGKISTRSIDFVVLKPELDVLIAIEIDDRSHSKAKRQNDDDKKSHALKQAGIALLRIPATPALPVEEVKKRIVEAVAAHTRSALAPCPKS